MRETSATTTACSVSKTTEAIRSNNVKSLSTTSLRATTPSRFMPLKSGGLLTIHVSQHNQIVCVSVEDNGVGRAYAAQNAHLHSSKQGLSILNRQIEIYNRFNKGKIHQQINDLEKGTRFSVEVPVAFSYIN